MLGELRGTQIPVGLKARDASYTTPSDAISNHFMQTSSHSLMYSNCKHTTELGEHGHVVLVGFGVITV